MNEFEKKLLELLSKVDPGEWDLDDDIVLDDYIRNEMDEEDFLIPNPRSTFWRDSPPDPIITSDPDEREEIARERFKEADNPVKWYYILKNVVSDLEKSNQGD